MPEPRAPIVKQDLPFTLDYAAMRASAIEHIGQIAGEHWNHFGNTDPGITILEQLCFALTELGYCAQFPVQDVLTDASDRIDFAHQFFSAEQGLCSAPQCPDDWRKWILDQLPMVRAIWFSPMPGKQNDKQSGASVPSGQYAVALALAEPQAASALQCCQQVQALLNRERHLGELFLLPTCLCPRPLPLQGKLLLRQDANVDLVVSQIQLALQEYALPPVRQSGYNSLRAAALAVDQIFNGPRLDHGWIDNAALGARRQHISLLSLSALLADIPGVLYVAALRFSDSAQGEMLDLAENEIAQLELADDFVFECNTLRLIPGAAVQRHSATLARRAAHRANGVEAQIDLGPPLPVGRHRDIESYLSIQETFPENYPTGKHALPAHATQFDIALARQLRAYLTVYDQILANQFSQLAHLGTLFSWDSPTDTEHGLQNSGRRFATTYFSQTLYQVPGIAELLRGQHAAHYQFDSNTEAATLAQEAWQAYVDDHSNPYRTRLQEARETQAGALARRDRMLSHLLARHGIDVRLYHPIIDTCHRYGDALKNRIVIKNIWLQNWAALSYRRNRAASFGLPPQTGANLGTPGRYTLGEADLAPWQKHPCHPSLQRWLGRGFDSVAALHGSLQAALAAVPNIDPGQVLASLSVTDRNLRLSRDRLQQNQPGSAWWQQPYPPMRDGLLDQGAVYARQNLHEIDFMRFSGIELLYALLLGLPEHYLDLAAKLLFIVDDGAALAWLQTCAPSDSQQRYLVAASDLSVVRDAQGDTVEQFGQPLLRILWGASKDASLPWQNLWQGAWQAHLDQLVWLACERRGMLLIEHTLLQHGRPDTAASTPSCVTLALPAWVSRISSPELAVWLTTLQHQHWPAHLALDLLYLPHAALGGLIHAFLDWQYSDPASDASSASILHQTLTSLRRSDPSNPSGGQHG